MSQIKKFLQEIADEIGKPRNQMNQIIHTQIQFYSFQKNWYDTKLSLLNLTDAQFQKMNVPVRLASIIRHKLLKPNQNSKIQQKEKIQKKQIISQNKIKQHNQQLETIQVEVDKIFTHMQSKINKQDFLKVCQLLDKIFTNINNSPLQQKFRKINTTGNTFLYMVQFDGIKQLFSFLGFKQQNKYLIYKDNVQKIHVVLKLMQSKGLHKSHLSFNPYQASTFGYNNNNYSLINQQSKNMTDYNQLLNELVEKRNKIMSTPIKNRKIRVFEYKKQSDLSKRNNQESQMKISKLMKNKQIVSKWNRSKNCLKLIQFYQIVQQSQKFSSKRKQQFEKISEQPVFSQTLIHIKLPHNIVWEGYFSPMQTVEIVFNIFGSYLIDSTIKWYLYQTPPVQKLNTKKYLQMTLYNLGCVPRAILFFGVQDEMILQKQKYFIKY